MQIYDPDPISFTPSILSIQIFSFVLFAMLIYSWCNIFQSAISFLMNYSRMMALKDWRIMHVVDMLLVDPKTVRTSSS